MDSTHYTVTKAWPNGDRKIRFKDGLEVLLLGKVVHWSNDWSALDGDPRFVFCFRPGHGDPYAQDGWYTLVAGKEAATA